MAGPPAGGAFGVLGEANNIRLAELCQEKKLVKKALRVSGRA